MSNPLNPNAQFFQPTSSSLVLIPTFTQHLPNPPVLHPPPPPPPPPPSLLPPLNFLPVLPQYPSHLQVPPFYHQSPPTQRIFNGFPPPPPLPLPILISDYTHHGSMMRMGTFNHLYEGSSNIPTGCFLRSTSTDQLQLPPTHHHCQICSSTSSCCATANVVHVPNHPQYSSSSGTPANVVYVPQPPQSSSSEPIQQFGKKTTVMIKNIPYKYSRQTLLQWLSNHCKTENEKLIGSEENSKKSAFDFVYLPIDFKTGHNKGYAFVNLTNPYGVWRLYNSMNYFKWDWLNSKKKICQIAYAKVQGKEKLMNSFNRSIFACDKDEFLPVCFNPYCDGSLQDEFVNLCTVGTRTKRLLPPRHRR